MLVAMALTGSVIINIVLVAYWVAVVFFIISEDRDPTAALAWLLVLMALPFVGLILYFFFGRNWPIITQRAPKTKRILATAMAFMPAVYDQYRDTVKQHSTVHEPRPRRSSHLIENTVYAPIMPVRTCDIYANGGDYFEVLLADLAAAQRFIHMSYFIWGKDELTARITDILLERMAAGVEVRILNDSIGCISYKKDELKKLAAAGAIVASDVTGLQRVNYSNHRKITVVDAEIGHSGGVNIAQEYIDGGKRFPAWRDTGIRITGPGVADLEKLFALRWLDAVGDDLFDPKHYPDPTLPHGEIMIQTVHQGYDDPWNASTRAHQLAISAAKHRVLVQTPYFVPDATTKDALINAAASGIRVDLMTTSWLDKKVPWWAAESFFEKFLEAGGHIHKWEKGFLHAKSLTIDGEACAIGTMNLDIRSLKINKELMIWVYDPEIVAKHEQIFEDDLRECHEVTLEEVRGWSRGRRFRSSVFRLFSNLL